MSGIEKGFERVAPGRSGQVAAAAAKVALAGEHMLSAEIGGITAQELSKPVLAGEVVEA
jgi:hypothetical protein